LNIYDFLSLFFPDSAFKIVIREFTSICVARLLEVEIQDIRLFIVLSCAIDFATVPNVVDGDLLCPCINLIHYTVVTHPNAI